MWEIFSEAIVDAVEDCVKVVPILFLAYLLVSYFSHDHNHKFSGFLSNKKKTSVLYASFLGCIPQCGFSSVIADLYSRQKVTLGTLVAVFIATSDEAVPIMIASPSSIVDMLILIAIKLVLALFWGYVIDFAVSLIQKLRKKKRKKDALSLAMQDCYGHDIEKNVVTGEHAHSHKHVHECGHIHSDECEKDCHHGHDCCVDNIFLDAFLHTFEISIYIFVATFVINMLVNGLSADVLTTILTNNVYIQILIACVVGLIPNCSASVLLVELFMQGALNFAALVAGLSTGAGVGLFILANGQKKKPLKTVGIILLMLFVGIVSGAVLTIFNF